MFHEKEVLKFYDAKMLPSCICLELLNRGCQTRGVNSAGGHSILPQQAVGACQVAEHLGEDDFTFLVEVKRLVDPQMHRPTGAVWLFFGDFPQKHAIHRAIGQLRVWVDARLEFKVVSDVVIEFLPVLFIGCLHGFARQGAWGIDPSTSPHRLFCEGAPEGDRVFRLEGPKNGFHRLGIFNKGRVGGVWRGACGEPNGSSENKDE